MKTIGLLGGMSWESSIEYYRIINEVVREKLGGLHSAKSVMYSVDFAEIEVLQTEGKWAEATEILIDAARRIECAGADFLVICTNTMHKMAPEVSQAIPIPLLHIADSTAWEIKAQGLKRVGLLGTRFTMEQDFYRGRLLEKHDLEVLIPSDADRKVVNEIIYQELVLGVIEPSSKTKYLEVIDDLLHQGAEGIILGCTEIGLLIQTSDVETEVFDTARIHAVAAVEYALGEISLEAYG
jgi:aspartate racemase